MSIIETIINKALSFEGVTENPPGSKQAGDFILIKTTGSKNKVNHI